MVWIYRDWKVRLSPPWRRYSPCTVEATALLTGIIPSIALLVAEAGTELGYRVVAIDRPGYGASRGLTGDDVRISRRLK